MENFDSAATHEALNSVLYRWGRACHLQNKIVKAEGVILSRRNSQIVHVTEDDLCKVTGIYWSKIKIKNEVCEQVRPSVELNSVYWNTTGLVCSIVGYGTFYLIAHKIFKTLQCLKTYSLVWFVLSFCAIKCIKLPGHIPFAALNLTIGVSLQGLRTLLICTRILTEQEWVAFNEQYQAAAASIDDRDQRIAAVAELIEMDFELIGATAIEDKLQDGVPAAISTLVAAKIKARLSKLVNSETVTSYILTESLWHIFTGERKEKGKKKLARVFQRSGQIWDCLWIGMQYIKICKSSPRVCWILLEMMRT